MHLELRPCLRTVKSVEHESDGDNNCNWRAWNDLQRLGKGTERVGNWRTNWKHTSQSIVEIGKNIEKCQGHLRIPAVTQCKLVVFHWSLNDSKSPQLSIILLGILANLKNAVVWIVLILPLIFNSSNPLSNHFGTIPSTSAIIGITASSCSSTFLVLWQCRNICLSFLFVN